MPDPFGWLLCQNLDYLRPYKTQVEPGYKDHPIEFMVDILRPFRTIGERWRPRDCVIFVCLERLHFFVWRGCGIFLSKEVACFFIPRHCEFSSSQFPSFPSSPDPRIPRSQVPKFSSPKVFKFQSSKVPKFPCSKVPKFQSFQDLKFQGSKFPSSQSPKFPSSQVPKFPSSLFCFFFWSFWQRLLLVIIIKYSIMFYLCGQLTFESCKSKHICLVDRYVSAPSPYILFFVFIRIQSGHIFTLEKIIYIFLNILFFVSMSKRSKADTIKW